MRILLASMLFDEGGGVEMGDVLTMSHCHATQQLT
jgi:hypothetical protein